MPSSLRRYSATRVSFLAITTAETWTVGNIVGGLLLLAIVVLASIIVIRVTLRR